MQTVVGIAGLVDVPAFQWAVDRVFRAHAHLLRGFGCDAAGREISVQACETPRVREVDLREYSAFERDEAALRLEEHERCEEFPLGAPPLIRLLLLRVGEREQRFVVTSHRAVLDDWSHAALVRALLSAHGWNVAGDGDGANDGSWRGGTADGGPLARLTQRVPADLVGRLLDRAAEYGIDAETIVQGAWAVALSELSGRRDVLFGGVSPGAARMDAPGVSGAVGFPGAAVIRVRRVMCCRFWSVFGLISRWWSCCSRSGNVARGLRRTSISGRRSCFRLSGRGLGLGLWRYLRQSRSGRFRRGSARIFVR